MEASAHLRNARISPRKVSIVLDLIRGKDTAIALGILKNTRKAASEYLIKLLRSAVANAENNHNMEADRLYVSECFVTPASLMNMKRMRPRAKGSGDRILKRTSHVTLTVSEKNETETKTDKKVK